MQSRTHPAAAVLYRASLQCWDTGSTGPCSSGKSWFYLQSYDLTIIPTQEPVTLAFDYESSQVLCAQQFHLLFLLLSRSETQLCFISYEYHPGPVISARLWKWGFKGWRGGSCRASGSVPSIHMARTSVLHDPTPSSGPCRHYTCVVHTQTSRHSDIQNRVVMIQKLLHPKHS